MQDFFRVLNSNICDRSIGSLLIWRDYYNTCFFIENDTLYFKYNLAKKRTVFTYPISKTGNIDFSPIKKFVLDNNYKTVIFGSLTETEVADLLSKFPAAKITYNDKWSDYVYNALDLANLSGKKYHGQKNFVNRFNKLYPDYEVSFDFLSNIDEIKTFLTNYYAQNVKNSNLFNTEKSVIYGFLDNFASLGQEGIVIKVANQIVAVAFGERINDYFYVHFEKANTLITGSYQKIVNEFSKKLYLDGVKFINREDDANDEGLRQSKLAYHPVLMAKKYYAEILVEDFIKNC